MLGRGMALCLHFAGAHGWATRTQTLYGGQIADIQAQMRGGPYTRRNAGGTIGASQADLGYLWHMPENVSDTTGLGGGITWAWDPKLCDQLAPRFREDIFGWESFLNCDDYKAAVARAFDKWSANNRWIKFLDVSRECEMAGLAYDEPPQSALPGQVHMPHNGCQLAEIWITKYRPPPPPPSGRRLSEEMPRTRASSLEPVSHQLKHTYHRSTRRLQQNGSDDGSDDGLSDTVSAIGASSSTAVATAQAFARFAGPGCPRAGCTNPFRYTNGQHPSGGDAHGRRQVVEAFAGTFTFNADDVCWYMDGEFCAGFHHFKESMGGAANARLFVDGMTYGLMAVGIFFYLIFFVTIGLRVLGLGCDGEHRVDDEDGDGVLTVQERLNAGVRAVSHFNPLTLTLFITVLVVPPLIENKIFKPCFECFDFEAAALHEIGHFLGLGHLDNIPQNWRASQSCGGRGSVNAWCPTPGNNSYQSEIALAVENNHRPNFTCQDPWAHVLPGVPPGALLDTSTTMRYPYRNSQMEARTQHNPLACLTDDDLEALATLYPDCSISALSGSSCHKVQMNIGYVRMTVYVLMPMMLALLFVVCCSTIIHEFEKRERRRDLDAAKALSADENQFDRNQQKDWIKYEIQQKKAHKDIRRKSMNKTTPTGGYPAAVTSTGSADGSEMVRR